MRVYPLGDKLFDNIRSKLREIDKQLPQKVLADKPHYRFVNHFR
jgi:hypothetical protein